MKNILAENMLRFGVKNLSESDVKNIEESVLTEAFTDSNGIVWPHFKDQKTKDAFDDNAISSTDAAQGTYAAIFGDASIGKKRLGTDNGGTMKFEWAFWFCQALDPNRSALYIPTDFSNVATGIFKPGIQKANQYNSVIRGNWSPATVYEAVSSPDSIKWWNTNIEFPKGTTITRWKLFSQSYLAPSLVKLKPFFEKSAAPAAAKPAMNPQATAPVKKP